MPRACLAALAIALAWPLTAPAAPSVHAGSTHVLAANAEGEVFGWGANDRGQLGRGEIARALLPQQVPGLAFIVSVAVADDFAYGLTHDGKVLRWGGPLFQPRLLRLGDVGSIAASAQYVLAVERDGSVWIRGSSPHGLFGDGVTTSVATAVRVPNLSDVRTVAAGPRHALALKRDGTVWSWGPNAPAPVPGLTDVIAVAAGEASFAVRRDGTVWAWGGNRNGELGDGSTTPRASPARIEGIGGVTGVAIGASFVLAVTNDGRVWSWGANDGIDRGVTPAVLRRPEPIAGLSGVAAVAAGRAHALALHADGRVSAWGEGAQGALGLGGEVSIGRPANIPSLPTIVAVASGGDTSFAVDDQGRVHGWGSNALNQLGVDRYNFTSAAQDVPGISAAVAVGSGEGFSVALRRDGRVWAWGANTAGQLGDGGRLDRPLPQQVPLDPPATAIAVSGSNVLALAQDGTVWRWGDGASPRAVPGLANAVAVAAGNSHGLALRSDGSVWSFTAAGSASPVDLPKSIIAIAAGGGSSFAIEADGSLWSWGENASGQLGDGTRTGRSQPMRVAIEPVRAISTSPTRVGAHTLALLQDGTVRAWGDNEGAQLGSGDRTASLVPRRVPGLANVAQVTAGRAFSIALLQGGGAASWGTNDAVLGDGTFADRLTPAAVLGVREVNLLDLTPEDPPGVPPELLAPVGVLASSAAGNRAAVLSVEANLRARAPDLGREASVFVFALAPRTLVRGAAENAEAWGIKAKSGGKDTPIPCVLAQLNASGQLIAVSASNLQAYITGVLTAQGQAVSIINGVPAANIGGATFFVGYGPNAGAMINGGTNHGVVTVPGAAQCRPEPPQTGWWWNPAEDGRGFSIEKRGNSLFFAAFLYDVSGRSTWHVSSGPVSLDGSLYMADLLSARGGQTLGGGYPGFPTLRGEGQMTLAFNSASAGTLVWPGGAVPIQRFDIVPNGRALPATPGQPESGWWWNEQEAGRGFFLEFQNGWLDIAGYMYDDDGNPVWYLTVGQIGGPAESRSFAGAWWSYGNGMTLAGPWRPHTRVNDNVAPVFIRFTGADSAVLTLPNERTTTLRRHRF